LAVKTGSGSTVTVTTDSATTVVDVRPTTLQGLTIGQPVDVRGTTNSAGVVVASAVEQGDAHGRPDGDGPGGRWQPGE
jgi:hypothetical protein